VRLIASKFSRTTILKKNFSGETQILMLCMKTAARKTASVSKQYFLIQTMTNVDVLKIVEEDIQG
jgi:hypothetical protein